MYVFSKISHTFKPHQAPNGFVSHTCTHCGPIFPASLLPFCLFTLVRAIFILHPMKPGIKAEVPHCRDRRKKWFPGKTGSRITGSRIKDQGSVQNESNNLNKSCLISHLRDSVNAQAKIRENKRNRHKYNRYNKHKYTKYWKSHTKLEVEVPIFAYRLLRQLFKTDSYWAGLLVHTLYSHEISKLSRVSVCDNVSDFLCNFKTRSRFWQLPEWTANFQPLLLHLFKFSLTSYP